jgi:hypothetical protein
MAKLTEKQLFIGGLLVKYQNKELGVNVYELIKDNTKELQKANIDTTKINSANATLASLAMKGLATKQKSAYNEKMVTYYKATNELIEIINKGNDNKEEENN